jgi:hypothetical protein
MKPFVIVRHHEDGTLWEPIVILRPISARPLQKLSMETYEALPETFRCYACQDKIKKIDIGGIEMGQRLCKNCYPWLDQWRVGSIIKFDVLHHFPVDNY